MFLYGGFLQNSLNHHPFLDGIFNEINHPSNLETPHDYGTPLKDVLNFERYVSSTGKVDGKGFHEFSEVLFVAFSGCS
jgi:hypothetical protein